MKQGKAYGFFDCKASKEDIEDELPKIRDFVPSPSTLEISLIEGVERLKGDSDLLSMARKAKEQGMRYVMEATYPDATNRMAADELSAILNQAYQSLLYKQGEPFRGGIIYKEDGEYVFR